MEDDSCKRKAQLHEVIKEMHVQYASLITFNLQFAYFQATFETSVYNRHVKGDAYISLTLFYIIAL